MRRPITSRVHGWMDYTIGPLMGLTPFLFRFHRNKTAAAIPIAYSAASLGTTLFTDYELGMRRRIPLRYHLLGDVGWGALLVASPWLFGFSKQVKYPHVALGAFAIGTGLLTEPEAGDRFGTDAERLAGARVWRRRTARRPAERPGIAGSAGAEFPGSPTMQGPG